RRPQPRRDAAPAGPGGVEPRRGPRRRAHLRGGAPRRLRGSPGGRRDRGPQEGTATVGGQRQYTGTAGRVENAQGPVSLVYASRAGHAVIDRELYLPQGWTCDPARLRAAGVPEQ